MDTFGGMENVLTLLLSSHDIHFNNDQLLQINEIIVDNNNYNPNRTLIRSDNDINESEKQLKWTHCFSETDTFLHSLFGNNRGQTIFNVFHTKLMFITTVSLWLISTSMYESIRSNHPMGDHIVLRLSRIIIGFCFSILMILILLSSNKECFKLIIHSFEFWLKIFYAIYAIINLQIYV